MALRAPGANSASMISVISRSGMSVHSCPGRAAEQPAPSQKCGCEQVLPSQPAMPLRMMIGSRPRAAIGFPRHQPRTALSASREVISPRDKRRCRSDESQTEEHCCSAAQRRDVSLAPKKACQLQTAVEPDCDFTGKVIPVAAVYNRRRFQVHPRAVADRRCSET